jgi:hypothetical protein
VNLPFFCVAVAGFFFGGLGVAFRLIGTVT